jgi:chemosensory pili system protein ChpA (sensor histidine kinase/response regulator)
MLAEAVRSLSDAQEAIRDGLEGISEADYILPFQEIAGALDLADMEEVAALTRKLERVVNAALFALNPDDGSGESTGKKEDEPKADLDSLTDAVAALELYLTGCRDQQANSTRYLEIMQARLEGLPEASASGESLPNTRIKLPDLRSVTSVAIPESGQDELDDEIKAVFLEEFAGVESQLLESATAWRENIVDPQLIIEIRRGFHTLKGSGRMVGANEIGDFSWDFEQLLNAASENRIEVDSTVHMLVSLAVTALRDLKARMLQQHTDLEAVAVMRLRDCARQLAEGIPPSLAALKQSLPEHLASLVRGVPDSEMTDSQAGPKARDSMDPSLAKLMIGELQQHQALLTPFVEQVEVGSAIGDANLIQAVHTLAGTLALAPLGDEARVAGALEKLLQESLNRRVPLTARAGLLLRRCLDRFALRLALLEEDSEEEFPSEDASLLQSLAEMTGNLDQIASEIPDAVLQVDHTPEPELTATPVTETPADIPTTVAADQPREEEPTSVAEGTGMDVEDMDILIIFLDEAIEVLERCDSLLNDWRSKLSDQKLVQNLQREIHTFKGGARMAGLHPLGELSHAMETLLEQIAGNRLQATIAAVQALEEGCDQLNIWVEQLNGNVMPEAGQALDRFIKKSEALALLPSGQAEAVDAPAAARVEPDIQQPETPQEEEPLQVTDKAAADEVATGSEIPSEDDSEAMRDAVLAEDDQAETKAEEEDSLAAVEPVEIASVSQTPVVHEVVALPDQNPPDRKLRDITERPVTDSTDDSRGQPHIRVASGLMDTLVNYAGEVSIYRARLEQQLGTVRFNLNEADGTVERLKEQLRKMDIETEAQMLSRYKHAAGDGSSEFDPLELDRFSNMQQLSRSLTETVSDLMSLQAMLDESVRQAESLLVQQSRVSSDLQEGLMQTRMTPFGSAAPRLRRVIRTAATETGKKARLQLRVAGSSDQLDRNVLERITAPLEHLLRNAIVHGIESPKKRRKLKKPEEGVITVTVEAETTEFVIRVQDDGAGVNIDNVRKRAIERGMIKETDDVTPARLIEFILESGFSTTETVTGLAGRGVGMDVVNSEVKQIGGSLEIGSEVNRGTSFTIRIPFSLAVMQAIGVRLGERPYMIPLNSVAGVTRVAPSEYAALLESASPSYEFAGEQFPILDLEHMLGENSQPLDSDYVSLLMVRSGEHTAAFHIPEIQGHQEIIIKPVGPQISSIPGILGGTISGDGQVVLILDIGPLIRRGLAQLSESAPVAHKAPEKPEVPLVMVVDDSITMRKVTSRVLESHGLDVMTAKDGVDALEKLGEEVPALILLDIEMPRMDGYELAEHVRADARLREIPIIMITSRAGQKHRKKARKAGANDYLTKPYQEPDLIAKVGEMLETSLGAQGGM